MKLLLLLTALAVVLGHRMHHNHKLSPPVMSPYDEEKHSYKPIVAAMKQELDEFRSDVIHHIGAQDDSVIDIIFELMPELAPLGPLTWNDGLANAATEAAIFNGANGESY